MAAARPAVIGAFVLGGLGLVVAAVLFFGGGRLFERTMRAVVFFEGSVAGLGVGAPVTFRGVRIGSVESIAVLLSEHEMLRIPVYIKIQPESAIGGEGGAEMRVIDIERLVAAGLRAQLHLESLVTGQLRIDLDFQPETPASLVEADTGGVPQIPSVPSGLERLRTTLADVPVQKLVETALHTLAEIERLAASIDAELTPLLRESRGTVKSATQALEAIGHAAARLETEAANTLRELDELAAATHGQVTGRGAELAQVLATADRVGREAERLLRSVSDLTDPRSRFRTDLDAGLRDLAASAASLRGFAHAIERDPSIILRGRDLQ